ncbi:zinc finger protein 410-like isoform X1 [Chiloscyllium plagiosum]|uniref:zinc finger protein 410-like isoform X1 n=1 Tax=Chiloscyllium plagiosum TaxID=36176 RepID=UPI001CB7E538|nr:zinc finger protein 410-like isoform X1 [Chiloscyllium plagiosum]
MLSDELESKPELLVQFVQNTFIPLGKGFEEPEQSAGQCLPPSKGSDNTLDNQAPVSGEPSASDPGLPIQAEGPDARSVTAANESVDGSTPWYLRVQELAHDSLVAATRAELVKDSKAEPTNDSKASSCKEDLTPELQHTTPRSEKTLKCCYDGCSRTFLWHAHLKYHLKTHKNDRSFTCPKEGCGKSFYVLQRLKVHMRTHNGEKPYICPEADCAKKFTTAGNLKNHMRIHTGEKPFVCEAGSCGRCFTEYSSLRKHMVVHSGEKPYRCSICHKTFSQSGSRNVHLRKYHNVLVPVSDQEETREAIPLADTGAAKEPEVPAGLPVATTTMAMPTGLEAQPLVLSPSILGAEEEVLPENSPSVTGTATTASVVVLPQPHHLVTIATAGHSYEEVVTVIIQ